MTTVYAFFLAAVGMGFVYLGIAFINGLLLPSIFSGLYGVTENIVLRLIAAFPLFFGPANYLVGKAYAVGGATVGGVGTVIFTVIWMTTMAIIVDQAKVNLWVLGGATVAIIGCLMVVHGIKQF